MISGAENTRSQENPCHEQGGLAGMVLYGMTEWCFQYCGESRPVTITNFAGR